MLYVQLASDSEWIEVIINGPYKCIVPLYGFDYWDFGVLAIQRRHKTLLSGVDVS